MCDPGSVYYAQEIAKQKAEEQRLIDEAVQKNCLAALDQVEHQIVREGPDISEIIKSNPDLANDPQTQRFVEFVATATNFASMKLFERVKNVPELITAIKNLLFEMIKEIKVFPDIARELQDLIHCFIKLVVNTKRNMELVIEPLQDSINHMEVVADALSLNSTKPLESREAKDIEIALQGMSCGIEKLLDLARTSRKESNDLDDKIAIMKRNIQQLYVAELAPWTGVLARSFLLFFLLLLSF
jgi:hypothetical protein